ncbi:hypothetical protein BT96DRAFT_83405 [Gymnopus androsaceus JB14]|uniref:Uncharacterized protein n=1 Tax=Gymnopus androsaceus JB14 TaxID=1447944 RepID=A0A6A4IAR6_9AGAR|nr:hypothetical protein BT96DRAFT_83405 [Gymnopus androsaceus JB14]
MTMTSTMTIMMRFVQLQHALNSPSYSTIGFRLSSESMRWVCDDLANSQRSYYIYYKFGLHAAGYGYITGCTRGFVLLLLIA